MNKYLNVLKHVSLFEGINVEELPGILTTFSSGIKRYGKKQTIFYAGSSIEVIGIVLSGKVQIIQEDFMGNRMILAKLSEADIFGEAFCAGNIKSIPVTVEAVEEVEIFLINYNKMISNSSVTLKTQNRVIVNMLNILALKNIFLNNRIEIISKRTTREKLIAFLQNEIRKNNNLKFTISFNRQQLADYICVDRSAMSNELSKMRNEGIIRYNRSDFEIMQQFE